MDVISPCVALTRAGKYFKGLCPFHPDKNPSMIVNPDRNTFHCFACGTGGDAYSFFMKFHHVPFPDALRELARQAGVDLGDRVASPDPRQEDTQRRAVELNERAAAFFTQCLQRSPDAEHARRALAEREIGPDLMRDFRIGYAPAGWDALASFIARTPGDVERAVSLGLIQARRSGRGHYDRFRNRIMFPICGTRGEVLAFGGRTLDAQGGPKYINSPESFLYKKGSVLYGLHQAQASIRDTQRVILVEGYMDLIAMHGNGFHDAVAILGTALTRQQIQTLKRFSRRFLFLFDGDDAGRQASFRNLPEVLEQKIDARIVLLPADHDPDSFLRAEGRDALLQRLDESVPLLDAFLQEKAGSLRARAPVTDQVQALRAILPVLGHIPDRLEKQLRIRSLAERFGIEERMLRDELETVSGKREPAAPARRSAPRTGEAPRWPAEERLACQILIQFPDLSAAFADGQLLEAFTEPGLRRFVETLSRHYRNRGTLNLAEILPMQEDPAVAALIPALSCREEFTEPEAARALDDSIRGMRRRRLQAQLKALNQSIREAETANDPELQHRHFLEKQRLLETLKSLQPS